MTTEFGFANIAPMSKPKTAWDWWTKTLHGERGKGNHGALAHVLLACLDAANASLVGA